MKGSRKVNGYTKPRLSYAQLIAEALMGSEKRRLTLNDIYVKINARHPYYSLGGDRGNIMSPPNWQNAVRHNLTLNKVCIIYQKLKSNRNITKYSQSIALIILFNRFYYFCRLLSKYRDQLTKVEDHFGHQHPTLKKIYSKGCYDNKTFHLYLRLPPLQEPCIIAYHLVRPQ